MSLPTSPLPALSRFWIACITVLMVLLGGPQFAQAGTSQLTWLNTPTIESSTFGASTVETPAFRRAIAPQTWQFPQDLGPHEAYQTEWWYYTGNLETSEGRSFGFQLTFFRQALYPQDLPTQALFPNSPVTAPISYWRSPQIYSAHLTISDIQEQQLYPSERFSRGALDLAGATAVPYQVWLEDWSATEITPDQVQLQAQTADVALDLIIKPTQPVLHGDRGFVISGSELGNASYYYSFVQQPTTGKVTIQGESYLVSGVTWTDHQYGTNFLGTGIVGWDWFSVQFNNGAALMMSLLKDKDGTIENTSAGTWINPDGKTISLTSQDFQVNVLKTWKSPESGSEYPARWSIAIPKLHLTLEAQPLMPNQELNTATTTYWEGAVAFRALWNDRPLTGKGYVELTGYADRLDTLLSGRTPS